MLKLFAKKSTRLQIVSDLHFESLPYKIDYSKIISPIAPNLAVLGDICPVENKEYAKFLNYCSTHFQKVFIIASITPILKSTIWKLINTLMIYV